MLARHAGWVVLALIACSAPPSTPTPPEAPVLSGDGVTSLRSPWTLEGTAPEDSVVRLHLDTACRGPALRDVTANELREGVTVDLIVGSPNVFSAVAIDRRGVASVCSAPISVQFLRPERPELIGLSVIPPLPSRETHFAIRGTSLNASAVRLFEGAQCDEAQLIATMSPERFETDGFEVDVEPNQYLTFVVDAVNVVDQHSACSGTINTGSDQEPPVLQLSLRSPTPSAELAGFVTLGDTDATTGWVYLGPTCAEPAVATCQSYACRGFKVPFTNAPVGEWSAVAIDAAGNRSACEVSPEPWVWDQLAGTPPMQLDFVYNLRGLVPASHDFVRIFDGPGCMDGHHLALVTGAQLAGGGMYLPEPSDGGVLSASGRSYDGGTVYPCSDPVPWN